jgi:hypothetical protein
LKHAEECGCKIVKLHGGIAWPREEAILKPHVEHCFKLREAAENKPLKTWLKFVANSLTGAFAQDPEFDLVALGEQYADDPDWEPVGRHDWIWRRSIFGISKRGHVHWAATLTGDARTELHCQIVHSGDDWVYSDTDSDYATRMLTRRVGENLGEWAFEGPGDDWIALAPKVYQYRDAKGARNAKCKGIPKADKVWPRIMAGEDIPLDRGVDSLLVAAKGDSLFKRRAGRRSVKPVEGWCGARALDGTRTRALHMSELESIPR